MSLNCGIIKDLLPLYAENICGEESREAVEAHLTACESCRSSLEGMKQPESASPFEALPLKSISKEIKKKQIRLVALALCLALFIITAYQGRVNQHKPIPYDPGFQFSVSADGNGGLVLKYDNSLEPFASEGYLDMAESGSVTESSYIYSISFQQYKVRPVTDSGKGLPFRETPDSMFRRSKEILLSGHGDLRVKIYYVNPNGPAMLLYGEPEPGETEGSYGIAFLPRLALNYYVILMAGLLLLIGILYLLMILLKKTKARQALMYLSFFPLSYILSHFAVKGMGGASWDIIADLQMILTAAAFACAAMALAVWHLKHKHRGEEKPKNPAVRR